MPFTETCLKKWCIQPFTFFISRFSRAVFSAQPAFFFIVIDIESYRCGGAVHAVATTPCFFFFRDGRNNNESEHLWAPLIATVVNSLWIVGNIQSFKCASSFFQLNSNSPTFILIFIGHRRADCGLALRRGLS